MSCRKARNNLDVKNSTLHYFIKKGGVKSAGGPTLLSAENEKAIAELVDTVAECGFSVGPMEIKLTAKDLWTQRVRSPAVRTICWQRQVCKFHEKK